MRFLITFVISMFLFSACSQAERFSVEKVSSKQQLSEKVLAEEALIKAVLKPLSRRNVIVEKVRKVSSGIPGFNAFEVTLLDKPRNVEINKYIWISKDGKYLILDMFSIKKMGKRILIRPVVPKNRIKRLPPEKVNLSWVKKVDEQLTEEGFPHVIGKGNKKIYIIWDVFCPFCYEHIKHLSPEKLAREGIELHMIPFPVHGKASIVGTMYFMKLSKEKGAVGALKYITSLGGGDFTRYVKEFEKESESYVKGLSKEEREKQERFVENLKKELIKEKVRGTPTIIYIPPGEGDMGYKILGYKPLDEVVKMK
jgi:thiol:disulfide interchange protein DsbC